MAIGYACLTIGVPGGNFRSCNMKSASAEKLEEIIRHNLDALSTILLYNKRNEIRLFRINSDIIPFGSSPVNTLDWPRVFEEELRELGEIIKSSGMRVSMHPGQYTVLNSKNADVVERAVEDLEYHCRFLDSMGLSSTHKIILHIGGVYDSRIESKERFLENYKKLGANIKSRLVLENDDKAYPIAEVLEIGRKLGAPVVFDNLHNQVLPSNGMEHLSDRDWIIEAMKTWTEADGPAKIHYSEQDKTKRAGSHSGTIRIGSFTHFFQEIKDLGIDIMLEVKDKNLSANKCIRTVDTTGKISLLEEEWGRYKYNILEHSHGNYLKIRELLKDKKAYPAFAFYELIEDSLDAEPTLGSRVNGLQHVWGYFKNKCTEEERNRFERMLSRLKAEKALVSSVKNFLFQLAVKYNEKYLLESLYFSLD